MIGRTIKKINMEIQNINPELYHKNYVALAEAIMQSGGNPFSILKEYEKLLIVLSNNHITVTAEHDHRFSNP
jgi:hypothetical protein